MTIQFTKMHGCGNDFVVIDAINQMITMNAELARNIANRHTGIGCDQILLVTSAPNNQSDFGYQIYNADGQEVGQCGNGARCLAKFIYERGLSSADTLRLATSTTVMGVSRLDDDTYQVEMGIPRFDPEIIPIAQEKSDHCHLELDGQAWEFSCVNVGNPHAVIRVDDVATAPVQSVGQQVSTDSLFPAGVNVGFMQILMENSLKLRVYERGAGETLACGSGACAAVIIGRKWHGLSESVDVALSGGHVQVTWKGENEPVYLIGPAVTIFEGRWE